MKPFFSLLGVCMAALFFAADCSAGPLPLNSLGGILHHVTESLKDPLQEVAEAPVKAIEPVTKPLPEITAPIQEVADVAAKIVEPVTKPLPEIAAPIQEVVDVAVKVVEPVTKPLPEIAAPIQEVVDVAVKVIEPVTKPLPEIAAPIQEVVDVAVKVVEPVTKPLPEIAAPIQEVVDVAVKVVEPVTKSLPEIAAPIQDAVETAAVAVEPLTVTLSDTLAPIVNTVDRTWSEVKPTVDKLVDTIAPITETVETIPQPQPGKAVHAVQQKMTEDKAVGDVANTGREKETTPWSQTVTPLPVEQEEPAPTFEIEEPESSDAATESPADAQLETPVIKKPVAQKPQSGDVATTNVPIMLPTEQTYVQTPVVMDDPEPLQAAETPSVASRPGKPEMSPPAAMAPIEQNPDLPSRSVEADGHPVEPDPMPLPRTDMPEAVLQGAPSCPNVSKITGGAAGLSVIGILNDDAHADVQSHVLLWVRSIELYKKWSNGPPGHPPKPSFSGVR